MKTTSGIENIFVAAAARLKTMFLAPLPVAAGLAAAALLTSLSASATPLLALKEAYNCAACHPDGRGQRPLLQRRCTLDCQGCHTDPSGGGPRNAWGAYYSWDQANTLRFLKAKDPLTAGGRVSAHFDARILRLTRSGASGQYPMNTEVSLALHPFVSYVHLSASAQYFGNPNDKNTYFTADSALLQKKYALLIDNLPFNAYVKAQRGVPIYGERRSNHTAWIRERIDLDQYALTDSLEFGAATNVPYFRVSAMRGDPAAPAERRQAGTSAHAGLRGVTLGWHANASVWDTRSQETTIQMQAAGAGANAFGILLYGERNWRHVALENGEVPGDALSYVMPSSMISEYTVAYSALPGIICGGMHETMDGTGFAAAVRGSVFCDWHPIPFVQLELWRRRTEVAGGGRAYDTVGLLHIYGDF